MPSRKSGGFAVFPYSNSSNSYAIGMLPVVTSTKVRALIGNGKSSFTQILLSSPLCQPTRYVSKVPAGTVIVSVVPSGPTAMPPIEPILPQPGEEKSFGSILVANPESHTIDDLYAERYSDRVSLPPSGSGATLPTIMSPLTFLSPSITRTCNCQSPVSVFPSTQKSISN